MNRRSYTATCLGVALVALFLVRAVFGWFAGPSYTRGRHLAAAGDYEAALGPLDRGAVGLNRAATLWLAGQVRVATAQHRLTDGATVDEVGDLLSTAYRDYTTAITLSPASGWYRASLADLYSVIERVRRHRGEFQLGLLDAEGWGRVGRPGRVAVGLTREAIEREPWTYVFADQLALTLFDHDLPDPAMEAVRQSAWDLPVFEQHAYTAFSAVPDDVLGAFAEASREALGRTPFLRPGLHRLALSRVEFRRREFAQAERDARAALELPGSVLNRAEAHYYLGRSLGEQGRHGEALQAYREAERNPVFEPASIEAQARISEADGDPESALALWRRARRLQPREIRWALEFARVAFDLGAWDKAAEALRWASLSHSRDARPLSRLVELYIETGDRYAAEEALRKLDEIDGSEDLVRSYRLRMHREDGRAAVREGT